MCNFGTLIQYSFYPIHLLFAFLNCLFLFLLFRFFLIRSILVYLTSFVRKIKTHYWAACPNVELDRRGPQVDPTNVSWPSRSKWTKDVDLGE